MIRKGTDKTREYTPKSRSYRSLSSFSHLLSYLLPHHTLPLFPLKLNLVTSLTRRRENGHGAISRVIKFCLLRAVLISLLICSGYNVFLGPNLRSLIQIFDICGFNISDSIYSGTLKLHNMQNSSLFRGVNLNHAILVKPT